MDMKAVDTFYCIRDHNPNSQTEESETAWYNAKEARENDFLCKMCQEKHGESNIIVANFFDYNIMKDTKKFESEDYYFCKMVRKIGFQIFCDLNVVVGHETNMIVDQRGLVNMTTPAGILKA
jgi:hypothetical protein